MKWYVQSNISQKDYEELKLEVEHQGMEFCPFFHIPFSDDYPALDINGPIFVYAASSVTDRIIKEHSDFAGVFAHSQDIDMRQFFNVKNEDMWSEPLFIGALERVSHLNLTENEYFIRPSMDNKWFAGMVLEKNALIEWIEKLRSIDIDMSTSIILAPVSYPHKEYRLCAVNGRITAGCQYREDMEKMMIEGYPLFVQKFAEDFIAKNKSVLPNSFIIDVALGENQSIGVIEVNSINSSGFYAINKKDYVKSISDACRAQKPHFKLKV